MKKRLTKRQWRRYRGKIIAKNHQYSKLRKVKFTAFVMQELVDIFVFGKTYPIEWFD